MYTPKQPLIVKVKGYDSYNDIDINIDELSRRLESNVTRKPKNPFAEMLRASTDDDECVDMPCSNKLLTNLSLFCNSKNVPERDINDDKYTIELLQWDLNMIHILSPSQCISNDVNIYIFNMVCLDCMNIYHFLVINHHQLIENYLTLYQILIEKIISKIYLKW